MGKNGNSEKVSKESELRLRIGELELDLLDTSKELERLRKEKEELEFKLNNQKTTVNTLLSMIGMHDINANGEKAELADYLNRQKRIFQNKLNHGFNVTNIYQEARYILEETAELMRAIEKNDRENMIEELADIVIFSYGCAEVARLGDLDTKIFEKMDINEKREYKKTSEGDFVKTVQSNENNGGH